MPEPMDVRITISFREKPKTDRCSSVVEYIRVRGTMFKVLSAFDTSEISTQAGVGNRCETIVILLRTCQWKSLRNCTDGLRVYFQAKKPESDISNIGVTMCDQGDKRLLELGGSCSSRIELTDAQIGCRGTSQSILEGPDIASAPSGIGSGDSQAKRETASFQSVMISFFSASGNIDKPAESLIQEFRSTASEAIIDVTCRGQRGLVVTIKCVLKYPMHSHTIRRRINDSFRDFREFRVAPMDTKTVREELNKAVLPCVRRWLRFSLEQCAATEMPLSELADRFCASAKDEQRRLLACVTGVDHKKDAERKQLLINNMADVLTIMAMKYSALGPSAKDSEITVSGPPSMQQARAVTEPVPSSTPVAPQSQQQTPMTTSGDSVLPVTASASTKPRRNLNQAFSQGASQSCGVLSKPPDQGSASDSKEAVSAGTMIIVTICGRLVVALTRVFRRRSSQAQSCQTTCRTKAEQRAHESALTSPHP